MHIVFNQPFGFSEKGQRTRQEDALSPSLGNLSSESPFFMVCDGVGGMTGGAEASRTVCESFEDFFKGYEGNLDSISLRKLLTDAVMRAYMEIDNMSERKGNIKMATTLTFLARSTDGIVVAYLGDSRIYHIRPSKKDAPILYVTKDHTLVNDLVEWGEIDPSVALKHPAKHILTKVMQAKDITLMPTITLLSDIHEGDYLFLCSDGVLERVTDKLLVEILCRSCPDKDKIATILSLCGKQTSDNNTCLLIPIGCVNSCR